MQDVLTPLEIEALPIPACLRNLPQWGVWGYREHKGRRVKMPYYVNGSPARPNRPDEWGTYDQAVTCQQRASGQYNGIGFVFAPSDPFCGVDLDHCHNPDTGILEPWAAQLVRGLNSYAEISVSGGGVHVIVKAKLPGKGHRTGGIEVYDQDRYFVTTGNRLKGTLATVEKRQAVVDALYSALPIIASARERYSERFETLFSGRWEDATDDKGQRFPSQSEADLALCGMAVYVGASDVQIDALMRLSGLYRAKWERADYREGTIGKAREGKGSEAKAPQQPASRLRAQSARTLVAKCLPPVRWVVRGLIPEGVTLLAGDAKIGKSWAALALGRGVATGDRVFSYFDTVQGDVLYLALEDADQRIQERLDALLGDDEAPDNLHITYDCSPLPLLVEELQAWMADHPETRLILVDVLAKVRPNVSGNRDAYLNDYKTVTPLQRFALEAHVGVVGVTHTNQRDMVSDILHSVTGTTGIVGSADTILLLQRARNSTNGRLHVTGRDVTEGAYEMEFHRGVWVCKGQPGNTHPGPEPTTRTKAEALLRTMLADGPRLSTEVKETAKAQGISSRTLDRARATLGVEVRKNGEHWSMYPPV